MPWEPRPVEAVVGEGGDPARAGTGMHSRGGQPARCGFFVTAEAEELGVAPPEFDQI